MTIFDKPYIDYKNQIKKLSEDYKLGIGDIERAKNLIETFSYYELIENYKDFFVENNQYVNNISIENLYYFLTFDKNFQNILFKYSVYAENKFKNILANFFAEKFGVDIPDYLNNSNFKRNGRDINWTLNNIRAIPNNPQADEPTNTYHRIYNHVPPWILFKNISFNQATDLYRNLKSTYKKEITDLIIKENIDEQHKISITTNSLIIIRRFRNTIAHSLGFISYKTNETLPINHLINTKFYKLIKPEDFTNENLGKDAYTMIICMLLILNEDFVIYELFSDISREILVSKEKNTTQLDIFKKYSDITELPEDIVDRFKNYFEKSPIR